MFNYLTRIDTRVFYFFNRDIPHTFLLNSFFLITDYLTHFGTFWILFCLVMLFSKNKRRILYGKFGLLNLLSTTIIEGLIIKNSIKKPRPYEALENVLRLGIKPLTFSFPSGQAAVSFSMAIFYWLMFPKTKTSYFLLIFALLTSLGRVYLGAHYPSDILGGAIIGVACGLVFFRIFRKYNFLIKNLKRCR